MKTRIFSALRDIRRWQKVLNGTVAVLLLTAIPAFGFVYVTDWTVVQNAQTGGAPAAVITNLTDPEVRVSMGVNSNPNSTSRVIVTRQFTIGPGGETIALANSFSSQVQDGSVQVDYEILAAQPSKVAQRFFQNVTTVAFVSSNQSSSPFLAAGTYTVRATIYYINRTGFWSNPSGSAHRFSIAAAAT